MNYCTITELLQFSNSLSIAWGFILIIGGRRGFSLRTLNDHRLLCSLSPCNLPSPSHIFFFLQFCMSIEKLSFPELNLAPVVIREYFLLLV